MNLKLKGRIRAELFRKAISGEFVVYEDFYKHVSGKEMKGQFPWTTHFDAIAREERRHNYPDITFLVRSKTTNYPSQIDFKSAKPKPTAAQLKGLRKGTDALIALYCPGKRHPY